MTLGPVRATKAAGRRACSGIGARAAPATGSKPRLAGKAKADASALMGRAQLLPNLSLAAATQLDLASPLMASHFSAATL